MKTTLSDQRLTELRAEALTGITSQFVDPTAIHNVRRILTERGEDWAASVLRRPLDRRSRIDASFPWLYGGDVETLILADTDEYLEQFDQITT